MDRYFCKKPVEGVGGSSPSEAWLFAQALLGKPVPNPLRAETDARARREQLEWLAAISPEDARRVRGQLSEEADARAQRELLEWVAQISGVEEAQWDSSQHPRAPKGQSDGGQWVAKGGGGGGASSGKSPSFLDAISRRNAAIADLTGVTTPGMIRSSRLRAPGMEIGSLIAQAPAGRQNCGRGNLFATSRESCITAVVPLGLVRKGRETHAPGARAPVIYTQLAHKIREPLRLRHEICAGRIGSVWTAIPADGANRCAKGLPRSSRGSSLGTSG